MRPAAVLLDRDGTINAKAAEGDYVVDPGALELLPGAAAAIKRLNDAGIPVAVVTNQRGIALGRLTEDGLAAVHARLAALLARDGAHVDAIFHCPHDRGACACRKPGTAMLEQARERFGLASLRDAVVIGDAASDVQAGRAAGARTIRLSEDPVPAPAGAVATSLQEAVDSLLGAG